MARSSSAGPWSLYLRGAPWCTCSPSGVPLRVGSACSIRHLDPRQLQHGRYVLLAASLSRSYAPALRGTSFALWTSSCTAAGSLASHAASYAFFPSSTPARKCRLPGHQVSHRPLLMPSRTDQPYALPEKLPLLDQRVELRRQRAHNLIPQPARPPERLGHFRRFGGFALSSNTLRAIRTSSKAATSGALWCTCLLLGRSCPRPVHALGYPTREHPCKQADANKRDAVDRGIQVVYPGGGEFPVQNLVGASALDSAHEAHRSENDVHCAKDA